MTHHENDRKNPVIKHESLLLSPLIKSLVEIFDIKKASAWLAFLCHLNRYCAGVNAVSAAET